MRSSITPANSSRSSGIGLVELSVAMAVLLVISVSVSWSLVRGENSRRNSFDSYRAMSALRDFVAEMQNVANQPQNLPAQEGIGALYARYGGTTWNVPELPSAQVTVTCFANEATVPAELGGPQDLNFDGDNEDNLGNQSNGTDLKLVPVRLDVTFDEGDGAQTLTMHRLITQTTN